MTNTMIFGRLGIISSLYFYSSLAQNFHVHNSIGAGNITGKVLYLEDFGAVPDSSLGHVDQNYGGTKVGHQLGSKIKRQKKDSRILKLGMMNRDAFIKALASASFGDVIRLKDGEGYTFLGSIRADNLDHVTIDFAGYAHFLHDLKEWPYGDHNHAVKRESYLPAIHIVNSTHITLTSSSQSKAKVIYDSIEKEIKLIDNGLRGGMIDGNGVPWWDDCFLKKLPDPGCSDRPKLLQIESSSDVLVENLTLINSPYWTFTLEASRAEVKNVNVLVNRDYQRNVNTLYTGSNGGDFSSISKKRHLLRAGPGYKAMDFAFEHMLPSWTFQPEDLNTDGIDVIGNDIWIHDCMVSNDDDSICVKPLSSCTKNIRVENVVLTGLGATVGSVGPRQNNNCVDNVIFYNITMPKTVKGIYIKSDHSDCNNGEKGQITNILYEEMTIIEPLWWPIWIGPQAQRQPHTHLGGDCPLAYPFSEASCPTQGCVDFENITLRNIRIVKPLFSPGVVLGNKTNPIKNLVMENVTMHDDDVEHGWLPYHLDHWPYRGKIQCSNVEVECGGGYLCPECKKDGITPDV